MIERGFNWLKSLNDPLRNANLASRWIAQLPTGDAAAIQKQALEIVSGMTGVVEKPTFLPPAVAKVAAAGVEGAFRVRGKHPPVCRAMVRTMLHGHRYDGSRATRELGLTYTPVRDTFARTIEWALSEGLVKRPLPAFSGSASGSP